MANQANMNEVPPSDQERVNAVITITANTAGPGMLVSLATAGHYSSKAIDRRFYSYDSAPPIDLAPEDFWAAILGGIATFLSGD